MAFHQELLSDPSSSVVCGRIHRESTEDMRDSLRNYYDLNIEQLKPGDYNSVVPFVASDEALLYREEYPHASIFDGELKGGRFGIGIPLMGPTPLFAGVETSHQRVASAMTGEQLDFITPAGHSQLLMVVNHARLYELAEASRVTPRMLRALSTGREGMPLMTNPFAASCVAETFNKVLDQATAGGFDASRENFEDLVMGAILSVVDHVDDPYGRPPAQALFRRARDLVDEMEYTPPISILAAQLRVSPRTLHKAFISAAGLPPSEYFMKRRLNRVREALLAAEPGTTQVTTIATGLGFTELGRFAGHYRRLFGESPVQTLRRRHSVSMAIPQP
jgi:AraC family transcriptional regulator, ethanolamine operon transcriptional activator